MNGLLKGIGGIVVLLVLIALFASMRPETTIEPVPVSNTEQVSSVVRDCLQKAAEESIISTCPFSLELAV